MIDINSLKKAQDLKGKIKEFLSTEQIEQLAAESRIPHYIITNPITLETTYCFSSSEVNDWFASNYLMYNACKIEQSLTFLKFDNSLHKAPKDETIPHELSLIKNLYKLPVENINTPPGIYFLCLEGKIVYIGQSVNVAQRIVTHLNERQKEFNEVYFIPCHVNNLLTFEASLIRFFSPKYNSRSNIEAREGDKVIFDIVCNTNLVGEDRAA
jgi:hypothetical protein